MFYKLKTVVNKLNFSKLIHSGISLLMCATTVTLFYGCGNPAATDSPLTEELKPYFSAPSALADSMGKFRSPLLFESGEKVAGKEDWPKRRTEILDKWHGLMGEWPEIIENPAVEYLDTTQRESITQYHVRMEVAPGWTRDAYLLIPDEKGPLPAALVVYYEPETGVGLGDATLRDFAYQLAKRGFVTLSLGSDFDKNYYPDIKSATLQPLSMLAYMAANGYQVLANLPEVDKERVGVVGHSYGGKWAMFASCLYDKFALGVWSDGGIVFDETRSNVNYWEPWYLGYEQDTVRAEGIPTETNGRTGAYREMIKNKMDLVALHALMAPRPFLVSGGSEDYVGRWNALNHAVEVNRFLGYENRVAMHNRPKHGPTEESNEIIYSFFEFFLKVGDAQRKENVAAPLRF